MKPVRPYRGIEAADRLAQRRSQLLEAGLDLLGTEDTEVTVRAVCRNAGLAARYFYESFADKDHFVAEVYDWVIADIATSTQAAVTAVPLAEQTQAAMTNIVHLIVKDQRIGRLLFSTRLSNEVLARKRVESTALFATLLGQHVGDTWQLRHDDSANATWHFAVGGVAQTISAWLSGELSLSPEQLIDQLRSMLDALAGMQPPAA
ncbi:AcrR family transcriptional regulator [Mycobacterium frederiksbergense]|uniref:AcrR family transcriptional regulator n=1 Tax=Mycolicibacterium frederiksbergense TaxID=117567 RepID=A0ABT6L6I9_9MYCO|nr:TetR/AcrR family transcriptional regulator [Mycolicibacterium frederiksbergense]MDH6198540.1 AcrR family transcriptional regulator [Mycolicibacterium frederiksbergense]